MWVRRSAHRFWHFIEGLDVELHASKFVLQLSNVFSTLSDEGRDHVLWGINRGAAFTFEQNLALNANPLLNDVNELVSSECFHWR